MIYIIIMMLLCFHNSIGASPVPTVTMTESPASTTIFTGTVDLESSSIPENNIMNPSPSQTEMSTSSTNPSLSSSIFAGIAVAGVITVVSIIILIIAVIFIYRRIPRKHYLEKDSTPSHWL